MSQEKPQGVTTSEQHSAQGSRVRTTVSHLAECYYAPLLSYFMRRVASKSEAEELTQDVFLKISGRSHIDKVENAEAYLFTVAANVLRDRWRQKKLQGHYFAENDAQAVEACTEVLDPERIVQAKESLQNVIAAMATMSFQARNIFIHYRLENMNQQDIADMYGISRSAVEKHLVRALVQLGKHMGPRS